MYVYSVVLSAFPNRVGYLPDNRYYSFAVESGSFWLEYISGRRFGTINNRNDLQLRHACILF